MQPLNGENFSHRTANVDDGAHTGLRPGQLIRMPFVMLGYFISMHPPTVLHLCPPFESSKKHEYCEHVHEVEHGVFTPLVLSSLGRMGRETTVFYKQLAEHVSQKWEESYSVVMGWL